MKFLYVNTRNIYPHDRHIIDGLRQNNHEVIELEENNPGMKKYLNLAKRLLSDRAKYDAIFVGFPTPLFIPIVWLFSMNKIIFNYVSSQYESNIVSRGVKAVSFQALKWWLVDIVSCHLSWRVLAESQNQIEYTRRLCLLRRSKLIRSWSGLNEKEFLYDPSIAKNLNFTILFRGRFLSESGIDTVIKAAKILEDSNISFLIMGEGHLYKIVNHLMETLHPKNIEMVNRTLPIEDLRRKMQQCHISLGQMADHPRLNRTLPCKSFESLAMRLPYLTARNKAILELLKEDETCFCANPGDPEDLAKKILFLRDHREILERVTKKGYELFRNNLTAKHLADKIIEGCYAKSFP